MNRINPEKLLLSKWTAVAPAGKSKHFLVSEIIRDDRELVSECVLQAVIDRCEHTLGWRELTDDVRWLTGWR